MYELHWNTITYGMHVSKMNWWPFVINTRRIETVPKSKWLNLRRNRRYTLVARLIQNWFAKFGEMRTIYPNIWKRFPVLRWSFILWVIFARFWTWIQVVHPNERNWWSKLSHFGKGNKYNLNWTHRYSNLGLTFIQTKCYMSQCPDISWKPNFGPSFWRLEDPNWILE